MDEKFVLFNINILLIAKNTSYVLIDVNLVQMPELDIILKDIMLQFLRWLHKTYLPSDSNDIRMYAIKRNWTFFLICMQRGERKNKELDLLTHVWRSVKSTFMHRQFVNNKNDICFETLNVFESSAHHNITLMPPTKVSALKQIYTTRQTSLQFSWYLIYSQNW